MVQFDAPVMSGGGGGGEGAARRVDRLERAGSGRAVRLDGWLVG